MRDCIEILLLGYIFSLIFTKEFNVVRARVGGANTTFLLATHFAKRNTKFGGGGKELENGKRGRAKISLPPPQYERIKLNIAL
jgi:hypothetical protein